MLWHKSPGGGGGLWNLNPSQESDHGVLTSNRTEPNLGGLERLLLSRKLKTGEFDGIREKVG